MNLRSNFGCINIQSLNIALYVSGKEGRTNWQTDRRSDYKMPRRTFQAGGIKP